ncbi:MAG: putative metal-binding motif-containing protein [Myxococcota bacterium]
MLISWAMLACTSPSSTVPDADHDGFPADVDCDDADADVFPGSLEFCDGLDNDCSGRIDDDAVDARTWFRDADADSWGDAPMSACERPEGYVDRGFDCDDDDPEVRPLRTELCNGIDDDCDGLVDVRPDAPIYRDADEDGFGDEASALHTCTPAAGWIAVGGDCDDERPMVNPAANERCNGIDDDCDGLVDGDDTNVVNPPAWYPDADEDGFGTDAFEVLACAPPAGSWSADAGDCNDFDDTVAPGAVELCNGVDDDCDGAIDAADAPLVAGPRTSLGLSAALDVEAPVFTALVDLQTAYGDAGGSGPLDPSRLRAVVGTCGAGLADLPVRFLDDLDGLSTPGLPGDGSGLLVVVYDPDGDPATRDAFPAGTEDAWLYFAPGVGAGSAQASAAFVSSGVLAADLDGSLAITGLSTGELSQGTFRPRLETPAGSLGLGTASAVLVDAHPAVSRVQAVGASTNAVGSFGWTAEWLVISGQPVLYGSLTMESLADTTLVDPIDWRSGVVSFSAGLGGTPSALGPDWLYSGASDGVALRVVQADGIGLAQPGYFEVRGSAAPGVSGPSATVPAGVALADTRLRIVADALSDVPGSLASIDASLTLDVGP